jgi:hypothetical protein
MLTAWHYVVLALLLFLPPIYGVGAQLMAEMIRRDGIDLDFDREPELRTLWPIVIAAVYIITPIAFLLGIWLEVYERYVTHTRVAPVLEWCSDRIIRPLFDNGWKVVRWVYRHAVYRPLSMVVALVGQR